ncbi:MAG: hypothetical protein ETSY2_05065 [Candidatus Entotheonella gemina]|uniref:Uncharacterized protein n=1 Tax=Candidatus Entotheonella gemina TaxID=1429439 RepID=W4MFR5_9BACT|nr:MAG: hypothetical protein ETSY2_05065 [Candidatus Entotheonella gemina]
MTLAEKTALWVVMFSKRLYFNVRIDDQTAYGGSEKVAEKMIELYEIP